MLCEPLREIRFEARVLLPAIVVGLLVFAQWIALGKWVPYPHLGWRVGFNPFEAVEDSTLRAIFLSVRFFGLVLMVPVMEEIFWRSFLLRYATNPDFEKLPVGVFSWTALALVSGAFALAHSEWLVAFITACAYAPRTSGEYVTICATAVVAKDSSTSVVSLLPLRMTRALGCRKESHIR